MEKILKLSQNTPFYFEQKMGRVKSECLDTSEREVRRGKSKKWEVKHVLELGQGERS